jgi:predicted Zn-dependent protease
LGVLLAGAGRGKEAIEHCREAWRLKPELPAALLNLAWLLATEEPAQGGNAAEAVQLAETARRQGRPEDPASLDVLAAAYAAAGRFPDALHAAETALHLAESSGQTALAEKIRARLELFRAGRPCRQP